MGAVIVRKLRLEAFHAGRGEVIDRPDRYLLSIGLIATRVGPDIAVDVERSIPRLLPRSRHAADGVVLVFAVVRKYGELRVFAVRVSNQLLANQKIALGRPAAINA